MLLRLDTSPVLGSLLSAASDDPSRTGGRQCGDRWLRGGIRQIWWHHILYRDSDLLRASSENSFDSLGHIITQFLGPLECSIYPDDLKFTRSNLAGRFVMLTRCG